MFYATLTIIFQKKAKYTKYELMKNIKQGNLLKIFTNAIYLHIQLDAIFQIKHNEEQIYCRSTCS